MSTVVTVRDGGREIGFSYDDMLRYHGGGSPGGVAHAFKVLELTLPLLADGTPPERREITIETSFGGPGARDGRRGLRPRRAELSGVSSLHDGPTQPTRPGRQGAGARRRGA
jgi:hypothetical protein